MSKTSTPVDERLFAFLATKTISEDDYLAGLRIGDGMHELRVGPLDEDEAVLRLRRNDVEYQPSLLKHLRNRGLDLSGAPSIEEVRQTLRG